MFINSLTKGKGVLVKLYKFKVILKILSVHNLKGKLRSYV